MIFKFPEGATPIDPDEAQGLIPALATQEELNEFELINIDEAVTWAKRNRKIKVDPISPEMLRQLHKKMFGKTWKWAGSYRQTQKSIGIEAYKVSSELHNLAEDTKSWLEFGSFHPSEAAARFHHRLVFIHAFENGNGRHARLATDLLCEWQRWPNSTWGMGDLVSEAEVRTRYLEALRQADRQDYAALIAFIDIHQSAPI